jgi:UDP-galactopyranose mutase
VIDKRNHIAGNIYTEKIKDIEVHKYGAHIFHTSDKAIWKYMEQFTEFNHYINSPVARYQDELYNLPFNMNTFHQMWGVKTPKEAQEKIAEQIKEAGITEPTNLEEQAISLVGTDVYTKLVKGYTEKQWGRDCRDLPAFIIKRLPLRFIYDNNYFNDPYQGIPQDGYTAIVQKMLAGAEVELEIDYKDYIVKYGLTKKEDGSLSNADGSETYGKVLYTGMVDEFYDYKLGALEYRNVRFETEVLEGCDNYQGNAVVNYTEREIPYTRVIEHKHFVFGKQPDTVISREYSAEWHKGEIPYYPVNNERNDTLFKQYQELAKSEKGILFGGRLGQYKYYDMDKVVKEALDMAQAEK